MAFIELSKLTRACIITFALISLANLFVNAMNSENNNNNNQQHNPASNTLALKGVFIHKLNKPSELMILTHDQHAKVMKSFYDDVVAYQAMGKPIPEGPFEDLTEKQKEAGWYKLRKDKAENMNSPPPGRSKEELIKEYNRLTGANEDMKSYLKAVNFKPSNSKSETSARSTKKEEA